MNYLDEFMLDEFFKLVVFIDFFQVNFVFFLILYINFVLKVVQKLVNVKI